MSQKDPPDNPLEELQKQLSKMLGGAPVDFSNINRILRDSGSAGSGGDTTEKPAPPPAESAPGEDDPLRKIRTFQRKPKEIRDYLDRFVVKQEDAKKVLAVAICDHYNHVRRQMEQVEDKRERGSAEYSKQNVLLLGPTGVGKTYLMKNIARLIGVPFVKADATKFSETGYVGNDVDDLVRDLVKAADGNVDLAEYGIIYVDEIDKIASAGGQNGRDVSGRGVQINLLKLMEETEVSLFSPTDMMAQMQAMMDMQRGKSASKRSINTRNILFIVSGAFDRLAETIRDRVQASKIGFGAEAADPDADPSRYLAQAETTDFIRYGFEPEFVGRLPVRVACHALNADDLAAILRTSEGSILRQYRDDFSGYGIKLQVNDDAILKVADLAGRERTGARGLMTILERIFRDFKFELPSTGIKELTVDTAMIDEPVATLRSLIEENAHLQREVFAADAARFASGFAEQNSFVLEFTSGAIDRLAALSLETGKSIQSLCEERFKDFEHGLNIIQRNSGQSTFKIGKNCVDNPDKELSRWVVKSFRERKDDDSESAEETED